MRGAFAEALSTTPRMTEGPFYPDDLPLDTDNDLILVNDHVTPAVGEITHLFGKVTDTQGTPVPNARVEIWQVDHHAKYIHSRDGGLNGPGRDTNFQGFGRFTTSSTGEYYFRTIKPVPYPGRTPHIHFAVYRKNQRVLVTQCFVKGEPQNASDGILRRLGDQASLVVVDFKPVPASEAGELVAKFDLVIGATPEAP
ncbi:protocatechuate 3,4-dioxygenase [soil metagenome]